MKEQNLTREDMIAITELGNSEGDDKPQKRDWITHHCENKYHLTSINKKGGDTQPFRDVPGFKDELRRNPGKQQKRTWEKMII